MKIGIIGAGISGLSLAKFLSKKGISSEILEKHDCVGGIAQVKDVEGVPYHITGGHCFNTKFENIKNFVLNDVLPLKEWHQTKRVAKIDLGEYEVSYPIEFSVREIFKHDPTLALEISSDFFKATRNQNVKSLDIWFTNMFGQKLSDLYFKPYNQKIWGRPLESLDPSWVKDKLPIPSSMEFLKNLVDGDVEDNMPHRNFFYPKNNHQSHLINALSKGSQIQLNYEVKSIKKENGKWVVNGEKIFDKIVSTAPLNYLLRMIENVPKDILALSDQLKVNGITNILFKGKITDKTWTYVPGAHSKIHRLIHISNFYSSDRGVSIAESFGKLTREEITMELHKIEPGAEVLDYTYAPLAYVVFDNNRSQVLKSIYDYLKSIDLMTLGRFGEWDYYNMDICMKRAFETTEAITRT